MTHPPGGSVPGCARGLNLREDYRTNFLTSIKAAAAHAGTTEKGKVWRENDYRSHRRSFKPGKVSGKAIILALFYS